MINLAHGSGYVYGKKRPDGALISDIVNSHIDAGLQKGRENEKPRDYLGASRLGEPCARKLAYEYRGEQGTPFSGRTLRIFEKGHRFEEMMIDWLKAAGFDMRTRNKAGGQFGFETMNGRVQGHIDAVIMSGPVEFSHPYPLLFEMKALNDRSWTELFNKGLQKSKEVYFAQVQIYMSYLSLNACLFTALNKNTAEIYHELVPLDMAAAQKISDRAVDIIVAVEAGELPPRISADPNFYLCKFCDFYSSCWSQSK